MSVPLNVFIFYNNSLHFSSFAFFMYRFEKRLSAETETSVPCEGLCLSLNFIMASVCLKNSPTTIMWCSVNKLCTNLTFAFSLKPIDKNRVTEVVAPVQANKLEHFKLMTKGLFISTLWWKYFFFMFGL